MLYMEMKQNFSGCPPLEWHTGDSTAPMLSAIRSGSMLCIIADGHELERIALVCKNIPMGVGRFVTWYGDIAAFIVANL